MRLSKDILIFAGIVFVSLLLTAVAHGQPMPNDYIAFVFPIIDFEPLDENTLDIQYQVGYIPMIGSATYTYNRATLSTQINLSTPSTINSRMRVTILDYGIAQGYNVRSIVYQDYNVAKINP